MEKIKYNNLHHVYPIFSQQRIVVEFGINYFHLHIDNFTTNSNREGEHNHMHLCKWPSNVVKIVRDGTKSGGPIYFQQVIDIKHVETPS